MMNGTRFSPYSMTGEGFSSGTIGNRLYRIEIRTLNHRYIDVHISAPPELRMHELKIRNILAERLVRGSVRCTIYSIWQEPPGNVPIQEPVLRAYLDVLERILREYLPSVRKNFDVPSEWKLVIGSLLMQSALRLPGVLVPVEESLSDEEWKKFEGLLHQAVDQVLAFRKREGNKLAQRILQLVQEIEWHLQKIEQEEEARRKHLETLLPQEVQKRIQELHLSEDVEPHRIHQELLFYLLRMDVEEEKTRIRAHLSAIRELLEDPDTSTPGKRLNFLCQELHREFTTLANKSFWTPIQHHVVRMKELNEQIREQVQNLV